MSHPDDEEDEDDLVHSSLLLSHERPTVPLSEQPPRQRRRGNDGASIPNPPPLPAALPTLPPPLPVVQRPLAIRRLPPDPDPDPTLEECPGGSTTLQEQAQYFSLSLGYTAQPFLSFYEDAMIYRYGRARFDSMRAKLKNRWKSACVALRKDIDSSTSRCTASNPALPGRCPYLWDSASGYNILLCRIPNVASISLADLTTLSDEQIRNRRAFFFKHIFSPSGSYHTKQAFQRFYNQLKRNRQAGIPDPSLSSDDAGPTGAPPPPPHPPRPPPQSVPQAPPPPPPPPVHSVQQVPPQHQQTPLEMHHW